MKLFLISPQASCATEVEQRIKSTFPQHHIVLEERSPPAWIVAAPRLSTPASVSDQVGLGNGDGDALEGLVVQFRDYFGYESKRLWQQLEVWLQENS